MPTASRLLLVTLLGAAALVGTPQAVEGQRPPSSKQQLDFGVEMAQRGLWNEALFRFHQAERLNPEQASILNNIAVAYEALGEFDEALRHYQRALRVDPNSRELKRNYARFAEFYQAYQASREKHASATAQEATPAGEPPASDDPPGRRE
ncbi:MAG TPA: tetratricopeptide repeat protein [Thermoanaerobaculia bacterium]|nr:tetratricopeptide repeat protein [Thermoanaerobaculia bacterium]